MKRLTFFTLIAAAAALSVSSCDFTTEPSTREVYGAGYYVLNSGNWGSNDANIGIIDFRTSEVFADTFTQANGKGLGDLAQDGFVYGSKLYIAVYGSATVFVTDKLTLKTEKAISEQSPFGGPLSPRHFAANGGQVFVTFYEGYVGAIDTATLELRQLVKVGDNPEGIASSGGKIYVANSGGLNYPDYGHTVSVIDASTFKVEKEIEVGLNPNRLEVDTEGNVFVLSWGNYSDIAAQLQKIDIKENTVSTIKEIKNPQEMAMGVGNNLYVITASYDEDWNQVTDVVYYNTSEGKYYEIFSDFATELKNKYSISTDLCLGELAQGAVFICTSDYISTGDIYLFDSMGNRHSNMDSGGMNPVKVIPVSYSFLIEE